MKYQLALARYTWEGSLPARGAWIEIVLQIFDALVNGRSLPARGAWIEIRFYLELGGAL